MKSHFRVNVIIILAILLAGCGPVTPFAPTTPTKEIMPTKEFTPTSTYEAVFADCQWSGTGFVWIDQNGDGAYQDGEQPVPDVLVFVDDILNGYTDVGNKTKTSLSGDADLSVWLPGCPDAEFEIYIQIPSGYTLTTQPRVKVGGSENRFSFGLTYLPGVSTATPLPPAPVCKVYPLPLDEKLVYFAINDDGMIWVSTLSNRLYSQVPGQTNWTQWNLKQYLKNDQITGVLAKFGYVWILTETGISVFDGTNWQSFSSGGFLGDLILDGAIERNGSLWFVTDTGISYFSLTTKSWRSFSQIPGINSISPGNIEITPDGSVWFLADMETVVRLVWPDHSGEPKWLLYSASGEENVLYKPHLSIIDFAADSDGNVWFVGFGGFLRYNPQEDTWISRTFETDINLLEKEFLQVVPDADGSVWMVERSNLYHYFPAGTKTDKDIMLEYSTGENIPNVHSLVSIEVGPDGKVWLIMEHEVYECEFFD